MSYHITVSSLGSLIAMHDLVLCQALPIVYKENATKIKQKTETM